MKLILLTLFLNTILFAKVISQTEQNGILIEAALFVGIFGTMGIISYIYSSKHAKEYKPKKATITAQKAEEKLIDTRRINELEGLLKNNILTQKEFNLLNSHYLLKFIA